MQPGVRRSGRSEPNSTSKAQAHQFKNYMQDFVREVLGTQLTGDPIVL